MASDFNKPVTGDNYATEYTPGIVDNFRALAMGCDPAFVTPANPPDKSIRWNSANSKWEKYVSSAWGDLSASYAISITGNAATATSAAACSGNAATATSATSAGTATHLAGGANGAMPYQTAAGATAMLTAGTSGYILKANGAAAPSWVAQSTIVAGSCTGSSGSCTGNAATSTTASGFPASNITNAGSTATYGGVTFNGSKATWAGINFKDAGVNCGTLMTRSSDGYMGWFNKADGGWSWYVDGTSNMVVTANVTAYSDERLKKNWRGLADGFVGKLAAVKHGVYERTDTEVTQVGVSAQSLQKLLPEAVLENENGVLSVAYGNAALAACVELAKEVVALRAEIEALKK